MGALPRYFLPATAWSTFPNLVLQGEEAHHCAVVMRKSADQKIEVFDGEGRWAQAKITEVIQKEVHLEAFDHGLTKPAALELSLYQAIPKGSNMDWIIEKAVELGIRRVQPILSARTVVRLDEKEKAKKVAKWQRVALEACKQCGQNWMPILETPMAFHEVFAKQNSSFDLKIIAALQPDSQTFQDLLAKFREGFAEGANCRIALAVGPEGDFTDQEYAIAREFGFQFVTLGSIILRVETATLYAVSVLIHELNS